MIESRSWLLTSTSYGTWLPGDPRGFVGAVWETRPEDSESHRHTHNYSQTPCDRDMPGLHQASRELMKGDPILLSVQQAEVVLKSFRSTSQYRGYELHAASVMYNHIHIVVTAASAILTDKLLQDFKSYASRALNQHWPRPVSDRWWTKSGSRRELKEDTARDQAVAYVWNQHRWLARWMQGIESTSESPVPTVGA